MKKNGFTLAEVLITLAIIGVVATMTLPALMTNTQEQQARTGLKKGINTLTEAVQMNQAVSGFDYASMTDEWDGNHSDTEAQKMSLYGILANRTNIDYRKDTAGLPSVGGAAVYDNTVYFQDGTALIFSPDDVKSDTTNAAPQPDGLPLGVPVIYDTNGAKGPNILSNCDRQALGKNEDADTNFSLAQGVEFNNSVCKEKANRVIKDQFTLRLRGSYVQPSGPAAHWVYHEAITGDNAAGN